MSEPSSDKSLFAFRTPWVIEVDGKPQVRLFSLAIFSSLLIGMQFFLAAGMSWIGGVPFRWGLVLAISAGLLIGLAIKIELQRQRILAKRFVFRIGLAASLILMSFASLFFTGLTYELRATQASHAETARVSKELNEIIGEGTIGSQSLHARAIVCHVTRKSFSDDDLAKLIAASSIENVNRLTFLAMSGTSVTSDGIERLGECRNLVYLDISGLPLSDEALDAIGRCKRLAHLLIGTKRLTPEQLARLRAALPNSKLDGE